MKENIISTAPETTPVSGQDNNEQCGVDPALTNTATATAPPETLAECAAKAVQNHKLAIDSEARSIECGKQAIQFAIACGAALAAAKKQLKHGKWFPWLEENIPAISKETAGRYMRLEKASHVTDLSECDSLRQAYLACDILKKTRKQEPPQNDIPSGFGVPLNACVTLKDDATPASTEGVTEKKQPSDKLRVKGLVLKICSIVNSTYQQREAYEALQPVVAWCMEFEQRQQAAKAANAKDSDPEWMTNLEAKYPIAA